MIRTIEFALVICAAIGGFYLHLESVHADKKAEYRVERKIMDSELNRLNAARVHYDMQAQVAPLSFADQERYNYVEREITRKEQRIQILDEYLEGK